MLGEEKMKASDWAEIKELFNTVVDLTKNEQRELLSRTDEHLRIEVEKLIVAHGSIADFMIEPAAVDLGLIEDEPPDQYVGRRIDSYKIVREIGHGGMGTVYVA
ncbi:MAG: hypothetical protein ACRD43_00725, partial [Pyrinomonadaceae bacterium]